MATWRSCCSRGPGEREPRQPKVEQEQRAGRREKAVSQESESRRTEAGAVKAESWEREQEREEGRKCAFVALGRVSGIGNYSSRWGQGYRAPGSWWRGLSGNRTERGTRDQN